MVSRGDRRQKHVRPSPFHQTVDEEKKSLLEPEILQKTLSRTKPRLPRPWWQEAPPLQLVREVVLNDACAVRVCVSEAPR